ncbi:MAG: hypothetical protein JXA18_06660 [Chitinispirillaceae bacterium]|nr:hypothetical protein [Chitinispirillaceae bacterium]
MLLRTVAIITLIAGQVAVQACLGPENVFGIQFNEGESLDADAIERLGEEDVNYYKDVNEDHWVKYSFRSHYKPSIMVEVMIVTASPEDVIGSLSFTVDTSVVPIAGFPFGACVRPELDWLVTAGILEMERIKRERIEQSFQNETQRQYPAASYFWTKQDSLLPNNAIFVSTEEGEVVVAQANCGGIAFAETDLPPKSLDIVVGIVKKDTKMFSRGHIAVDPARSTMLVVDINGRVQGQNVTGLKSNRPGVFVGYDRRSGIIKRMVHLQ